MKILSFLFLLVVIPVSLFSQSFNTAEIIHPKRYSVGINPVLYEKEPGIFIHGGYGINKKIDVSVKYGLLEGSDYIGADLEWLLGRVEKVDISLITGGHIREDIGLDAGGVLSFAVTHYATIFTGIDFDFVFMKEFEHYTWIPLGVEVMFKNNASFILEADVPMSEWAWNIFGGGVMFYFR